MLSGGAYTAPLVVRGQSIHQLQWTRQYAMHMTNEGKLHWRSDLQMYLPGIEPVHTHIFQAHLYAVWKVVGYIGAHAIYIGRANNILPAKSNPKLRHVVHDVIFFLMWSQHRGWVDAAGLHVAMLGFCKTFKGQLRPVAQGSDTAPFLVACPAEHLVSWAFFFYCTPQSNHLFWTGTQYEKVRVDALWNKVRAAAELPEAA